MPTLLQCIEEFIDNITVTDRQEENIKNSLSNIDSHLKGKGNELNVEKSFTTGSYERDTIIRPLHDIDLFAVLKRDKWQDEYGNLPTPQSVLTKIKNYLNEINDYKDKVKQDRPCVTIELSDKNFDILPSFEQLGGGYQIPNYDLKNWSFSYPEQLTKDLEAVNRQRNYKVKQIIRAVKYWNRESGKLIPSYHIEEVAISIFTLKGLSNFEEGIRIWFNNAEYDLSLSKYNSSDDHTASINKVKKVKEKLNDAFKKCEDGKENEAIKIWKNIFDKEFPTIDFEEAKAFSKAFTEGSLKISSSGLLSTSVGKSVPPSKGFFGGISED